MRTSATTVVSAPIENVWAIVSDPERVLRFMSGMTRWEVQSEQPTGLGARYRTLMRVGSAEVGGLIEIVEWEPPCELAWTSVTGIDQRGRWRLRSIPEDRTRVEIRLAYGVAGAGLSGWLAERDRGAGGHLPSALHLPPAGATGRARAAARPGRAAARRPGRVAAAPCSAEGTQRSPLAHAGL